MDEFQAAIFQQKEKQLILKEVIPTDNFKLYLNEIYKLNSLEVDEKKLMYPLQMTIIQYVAVFNTLL